MLIQNIEVVISDASQISPTTNLQAHHKHSDNPIQGDR